MKKTKILLLAIFGTVAFINSTNYYPIFWDGSNWVVKMIKRSGQRFLTPFQSQFGIQKKTFYADQNNVFYEIQPSLKTTGTGGDTFEDVKLETIKKADANQQTSPTNKDAARGHAGTRISASILQAIQPKIQQLNISSTQTNQPLQTTTAHQVSTQLSCSNCNWGSENANDPSYPPKSDHLYFYNNYGPQAPYYYLTNFYDQIPVRDNNGNLWKTAEALFQFQKFNYTNSGVAVQNFINLTGREAFNEARKHSSKIRKDWHDGYKIIAMLNVIRTKFSDQGLKTKLLNTGNKILVEDAWGNDDYWGNSRILTRGQVLYAGCNMLGQILMHVRNELSAGQENDFYPTQCFQDQKIRTWLQKYYQQNTQPSQPSTLLPTTTKPQLTRPTTTSFDEQQQQLKREIETKLESINKELAQLQKGSKKTDLSEGIAEEIRFGIQYLEDQIANLQTKLEALGSV